jgi:hypothetical protein
MPGQDVPYWLVLYEEFIAQTESTELSARLEPLEIAIFERLRELEGIAGGHEERLAIKIASDKLLEVKTTRLGFPPIL